jgi:uncharacterized protein YaeQ
VALKPTIYKFSINLSDLDRHYYAALQLTVAQHPSETPERMMTRVLAYCFNAAEDLRFTKGLSAVDEPDIWLHSLDQQIALWIDVGEPSVERVKKSCRLAKKVRVYSFNDKSATWWQQSQDKFLQLDAEIFQFPAKDVQRLASLLQRSMQMSVTISDDSAYVATEQGECEVAWLRLTAAP